MRRASVLDLSAVATALLAAAIFALAVLAISGFALRAADGPGLEGGTVGGIPIGDDWTGFHLEVDTHSGELFPGGSVNYLVVYENLGPVTETVRITDTLPAVGGFVGAWWGAGDQPHAGEPLPQPVVQTDTQVVWELPAAGSRQPRWFHVVLDLPVGIPPGLQLTDCVAIGQASDETTVADNFACAQAFLNPAGPNLAVAKTSEWQLPEMDHILYEIRYWNWGNGTSTEVPITDTLPVGTQLEDFWATDPNVSCPVTATADLVCHVPLLAPGGTGSIWLDVALDQPPQPLQTLTNTVAISTPQGDVVPDDNGAVDGAFTGRGVQQVAFTVATEHSSMWGFTPLLDSTSWITLTTPVGLFTTHPDPICSCFEFPDIGAVWPGDTVVVEAGAGIQPVTIEVPQPFEAAADSTYDYVYGQIGWFIQEPVEVALDGGPVRVVPASSGSFAAVFPDVPRGAVGEVRHHTVVDSCTVVYRRHFYTRDVVLNVHSRDDWVEGLFEAGYPVDIEVRDSAGSLKATAAVQTGYLPWLEGMSGFSTRIGDPWVPERPDIVPGDWVQAWIDPLEISGEVQVGDITGVMDLDADVVSGTITAPWLAAAVSGSCAVLQDMAPTVNFQADPNGGSYVCDFGNAGWDLQPGHQVLVRYWEPDAHSIMNQFPDLTMQPVLGIDTWGHGAATPEGNFEYLVSFWNEGGGPALNTVLTDTLPVGTTYITSTLGISPVIAGTALAFDVGTLEPGADIDFSLFVQVPVNATATLTNTVEIAASNVVTVTVPPAAWVAPVEPNDTDLTIVATPSQPEPEPGGDLTWNVEVYNVGSTSSATVEVTDWVPEETTVLSWWADQAGWSETGLETDPLLVDRPTAPGGIYLQLHLATQLSPDALPGQQLCNLIEVQANNDLNPQNNVHQACVTVGGAAPGVEIQKLTNGQDADDPPGPYIPAGAPVEWIYQVTNAGNVALEGIVVEDNQPGAVPSCPHTTLDPGASMTCEADGFAVEGQYENVGTVTATPASGGDPVSASDPSHYFGVVAGVTIEKSTNGEDADDPPGPQIPVGAPVEWVYEVVNSSNVPLVGVGVEDNQPGVMPSCPNTTLGPGEAMTCVASGVAVEGQYENLGTVTGTPPGGVDVVTAADPSHYLGMPPGLPFADGFESGDTSAWSATVP